jgi:diguanylate cyclase (GGDEF)-like protein
MMHFDRTALGRLAPFAGAASLAFVLVPIDARVVWPHYFAAAALAVIAGLCAGVRERPGAGMLPPMLFLVSAAVLRHAGGGNQSGVGALTLLPVFWLALYGSRRQLGVLVAAVAVFFVVPVLLVGGAAYPVSNWRTGTVFAVVSAVVGLTVQRLVGQVRRQAAASALREHELETVAGVARNLSTTTNAREAVCEAACELGDCSFAMLFEPHGPDRLAKTAEAGISAGVLQVQVTKEVSGALVALASRESLFVEDAESSPVVNKRLWEATGKPASLLFEPVLRGEQAVGVMVVGWHERLAASGRATSVQRLLAAEAGFAIERSDLLAQLAGLAATDPLTGLANRRTFDLELRSKLSNGEQVWVAMLDIDHFKTFNDSRGHQDGDRFLKEASAAWRGVLRPADLLARYGGEEFAVLLPECSEDEARLIVDRLRAAMPGDQTCSAGLALWDGAESADALLHRSDEALYVAKRAGRDRTVIFDELAEDEAPVWT